MHEHYYGRVELKADPAYIDNLSIESFSEEFNKAGFDIGLELSRRDKLRTKFGKEKGDLIWVGGVTDEVVEHAFEYSKKDVVRVPPSYEIVDQQLFAPRFAAFAQELVSPLERGGSVLKGFKKVQESVVNSPEGSFVIWSSPSGSLGIKDLEYDYSWSYFFKREGSKVYYVAVRTNFTLNEHADFLNFFLPLSLQIDKNNFGRNSLTNIRKIVETPVVITPQMGINSLRELGEMMSIMRANVGKIAYIDKQDGRERYFNEIIEELSAIDEKQQTEREEIQGLIDYYEERLLQKSLSKEQLLRIIGQYLLAVNYVFKYNLHRTKDFYNLGGNDYSLLAWNAYITGLVKDLQEVAGCAGGLRQNTSTLTKHLEQLEPFTCPKCGYTTFERVGNQCPNCGITKEEYAKQLKKGENICV